MFALILNIKHIIMPFPTAAKHLHPRSIIQINIDSITGYSIINRNYAHTARSKAGQRIANNLL